jgi:hypothetical protein
MVLTAVVIEYLAIAVENLCQSMSGELLFIYHPFLQTVNISRNMFTKSSAFDNAKANIDDAANNFTTAISDLAAAIGIQLLQQNEKILGGVEFIKEQVIVVSRDVSGILEYKSKLIKRPQTRRNHQMDWGRGFY